MTTAPTAAQIHAEACAAPMDARIEARIEARIAAGDADIASSDTPAQCHGDIATDISRSQQRNCDALADARHSHRNGNALADARRSQRNGSSFDLGQTYEPELYSEDLADVASYLAKEGLPHDSLHCEAVRQLYAHGINPTPGRVAELAATAKKIDFIANHLTEAVAVEAANAIIKSKSYGYARTAANMETRLRVEKELAGAAGRRGNDGSGDGGGSDGSGGINSYGSARKNGTYAAPVQGGRIGSIERGSERQDFERRAVEERAVEAQTLEGRAVDGQAFEGRAVKAQAFEGRAVEAQAVKGRAVEGRVFERQVIEGRAVEGRVFERQVIEGRAVEGRAIEGKAFEAQTLERRTVEGRAVEGKAVEAQTLERRTVEGRAVEGKAVEAQTLERRTVEGRAIKGKAVEAQAVEAQAVEAQAVEERVFEGRVFERQVIEGQAVEAQAVEGQAVEAQAVEAQAVEAQVALDALYAVVARIVDRDRGSDSLFDIPEGCVPPQSISDEAAAEACRAMDAGLRRPDGARPGASHGGGRESEAKAAAGNDAVHPRSEIALAKMMIALGIPTTRQNRDAILAKHAKIEQLEQAGADAVAIAHRDAAVTPYASLSATAAAYGGIAQDSPAPEGEAKRARRSPTADMLLAAKAYVKAAPYGGSFVEVEPQIQKLFAKSGIPWDKTHIDIAKALLRGGLGITPENMDAVEQTLDDISVVAASDTKAFAALLHKKGISPGASPVSVLADLSRLVGKIEMLQSGKARAAISGSSAADFAYRYVGRSTDALSSEPISDAQLARLERRIYELLDDAGVERTREHADMCKALVRAGMEVSRGNIEQLLAIKGKLAEIGASFRASERVLDAGKPVAFDSLDALIDQLKASGQAIAELDGADSARLARVERLIERIGQLRVGDFTAIASLMKSGAPITLKNLAAAYSQSDAHTQTDAGSVAKTNADAAAQIPGENASSQADDSSSPQFSGNTSSQADDSVSPQFGGSANSQADADTAAQLEAEGLPATPELTAAGNALSAAGLTISRQSVADIYRVNAATAKIVASASDPGFIDAGAYLASRMVSFEHTPLLTLASLLDAALERAGSVHNPSLEAKRFKQAVDRNSVAAIVGNKDSGRGAGGSVAGGAAAANRSNGAGAGQNRTARGSSGSSSSAAGRTGYKGGQAGRSVGAQDDEPIDARSAGDIANARIHAMARRGGGEAAGLPGGGSRPGHASAGASAAIGPNSAADAGGGATDAAAVGLAALADRILASVAILKDAGIGELALMQGGSLRQDISAMAAAQQILGNSFSIGKGIATLESLLTSQILLREGAEGPNASVGAAYEPGAAAIAATAQGGAGLGSQAGGQAGGSASDSASGSGPADSAAGSARAGSGSAASSIPSTAATMATATATSAATAAAAADAYASARMAALAYGGGAAGTQGNGAPGHMWRPYNGQGAYGADTADAASQNGGAAQDTRAAPSFDADLARAAMRDLEAMREMLPDIALRTLKGGASAADIYSELKDRLMSMDAKLQRLGVQPGDPAAKAMSEMKAHISAEEQLDRSQTCFQIPFMYHGKPSCLTVYVFDRHKGRKGRKEGGELSVALNLETESLGVVDIGMKIREKHVDLEITVANKQVSSYIGGIKDTLRARIHEAGFHAGDITCDTRGGSTARDAPGRRAAARRAEPGHPRRARESAALATQARARPRLRGASVDIRA